MTTDDVARQISDIVKEGRMETFDLTPGAEELLRELVEFSHSVPDPVEFMYMPLPRSPHVINKDGARQTVHCNATDFDLLEEQGLVSGRSRGDRGRFALKPAAFRCCAQLKSKVDQTLESVENQVRRYIANSAFEEAFPNSFSKWHEAAELLWSSDGRSKVSTIGLRCVEAMQDFADELAKRYTADLIKGGIEQHENRVHAIVASHLRSAAHENKKHLKALADYWGAIAKHAQNAKHANESDASWVDAKHLVIRLGFVMMDLDIALRPEIGLER